MKIGMDIGGMSVKIGIVNKDNEIIAKKVIPTRLDIPAEQMVKNMADAVKELLAEQNIQLEDCQGIGIGSPGTIDDVNGIVLYSNNFNWENVPIIAELKQYLDTEIKIANDADAAALGEVSAGAAKGEKSAVLLTLGTGVGSGVIMNGKIFSGCLAGGCEFGHMVIRKDGEVYLWTSGLSGGACFCHSASSSC